MKKQVRQTMKQRNIMGLILRRAGEGVFLSMKELHEQVLHGKDCTYGAIRLSVYALEERGMLVRERAGANVILKPTADAYYWFVPK